MFQAAYLSHFRFSISARLGIKASNRVQGRTASGENNWAYQARKEGF